jgi:glucuronoarabinoxylan endo-1,4-beta-xylanase
MEGPAVRVSFYLDDFDVEAPVTSPVGEIDANITHQTIAGFGGAIAFYINWITAHPYKQEMYTDMFQGLNPGILRLGNWFRYQGTVNFDPDTAEIVSNANRILGHPVAIEMSSWSPPAFLKRNGATTNGGTLVMTNGSFACAQFADYCYDSLMWYKTNGIVPTWNSIQNEPDWSVSYDSCVFHPTADTVDGTNYPSYAGALNAVFQRLSSMPSPPKLLGPEVVGIGYNDVQNYAAYMNSNSFYGVAHHLYHGGSADSADSFIPALASPTIVFPDKPKFQTEYGRTDMPQTALLINHCMTFENASAYIFWSLDWPVGGPALVQQENPWNQSSWTNAPPGIPEPHGYWLTPQYYAVKHFFYFITNDFKRVDTPGNDPNLRLSAYLSPDGRRLVEVMINPNAAEYSLTNVINGFATGSSMAYQTVGTNAQISRFASLGSAPAKLQWSLPGYSITTVVVDAPAMAGPASNPDPTNGAYDVTCRPA